MKTVVDEIKYFEPSPEVLSDDQVSAIFTEVELEIFRKGLISSKGLSLIYCFIIVVKRFDSGVLNDGYSEIKDFEIS